MERITAPDNLRLAFWKAAKGKRAKADCRAFQERLDENLAALRAELLSGDVRVGNYHYFKVHDPKERLICAAAFRERVLHHALMNVRYMDDFVIWSDCERAWRGVAERVQAFLAAELQLELKPNLTANRTAFGMDFLGYRLFPGRMRLARRSKVRFARKFRAYAAACVAGAWTELQLQQRMTALLAFVIPVDSRAFRQRTIQTAELN